MNKVKTKKGFRFKTESKKLDGMKSPVSFKIYSPDVKGVHVEAKRKEKIGGGLCNQFFIVSLMEGKKIIRTNKDNLFAGFSAAEATGRVFLKRYKRSLNKSY